MYPYFYFLDREIGLYAVCALLGIFAAAVFSVFQTRKYKIEFEDILLVTVFAGAFALVGAHLFYGMTQLSGILSLFARTNEISFLSLIRQIVFYFSGMVYYGGLIGAILGVYVYTHFWLKNKRKILLDTFATAIPLFHFFGRLGCFFGGCCYGIETPKGIQMPYTPLSANGEIARRFPVQLVEACFNLFLFFFLFSFLKKRKYKGKLLLFYLLLYPIARFGLEYLRGDAIRGKLFFFSTSQWISIVLFLYAAISLLYYYKRNKK